MVGSSSGFIESLPPKMKARISYLETLQDQHDELEEKFDDELKALEKKFEALYGTRRAAAPRARRFMLCEAGGGPPASAWQHAAPALARRGCSCCDAGGRLLVVGRARFCSRVHVVTVSPFQPFKATPCMHLRTREHVATCCARGLLQQREMWSCLKRLIPPPAAPLQGERAEIVKGEKEAPPPKEGEGDDKPSEAVAGDGDVAKEGEAEEVPAGIPEFWLNVLRNYEDIGNKVAALASVGVPTVTTGLQPA